jgi:hypothetical protein
VEGPGKTHLGSCSRYGRYWISYDCARREDFSTLEETKRRHFDGCLREKDSSKNVYEKTPFSDWRDEYILCETGQKIQIRYDTTLKCRRQPCLRQPRRRILDVPWVHSPNSHCDRTSRPRQRAQDAGPRSRGSEPRGKNAWAPYLYFATRKLAWWLFEGDQRGWEMQYGFGCSMTSILADLGKIFLCTGRLPKRRQTKCTL